MQASAHRHADNELQRAVHAAAKEAETQRVREQGVAEGVLVGTAVLG